MSRIGKMPISIPQGVEITINNLTTTVVGPKGELKKTFKGNIEIILQNAKIYVKLLVDSKASRSMWGTTRSIINSMIKGVNEGFTESLEVNGVGYKSNIQDKYINLALAKSHNTKIEIPKNIRVMISKQNNIILESIDKELLGQFISTIIKQRPPEVYKGKGIKRKGQYIQRKEGKKN